MITTITEAILKKFTGGLEHELTEPFITVRHPYARVHREYLHDFLLFLPEEIKDPYTPLQFILRYMPEGLLTRYPSEACSYSSPQGRYTLDAAIDTADMLSRFAEPPEWKTEQYLPALLYCAPPGTGPAGRLFRSLALLFHAHMQRLRRETLTSLAETMILRLTEIPVSSPFIRESQVKDLAVIIKTLCESGLIRRPHGQEVEKEIGEYYRQFGVHYMFF